MRVKAIAPYFGANRLNAGRVGELLEGCAHVSIPFGGGMCEVPGITARSIVVNDLNRDIINLARVTACPLNGPRLYRQLRRQPFHPDVLEQAREMQRADWSNWPEGELNVQRAFSYFICCWMNRSAMAGTDAELTGNLPVRWSATGGDSAVRYRSAVRSLVGWRRALERCNFTCLDAFEFLKNVKDIAGNGLYVDAPWPDDGNKYRHKFTELDQTHLAAKLEEFQHCRVVVRYGDHPLIRELYPESQWTWNRLESRTQANESKAEVLLVRNA